MGGYGGYGRCRDNDNVPGNDSQGIGIKTYNTRKHKAR